MAAENGSERMISPSRTLCFNEAAAHGRGKRRARRPLQAPVARFNEAAAHGRGKQEAAREEDAGKRAASMRPRRMAAENDMNDAFEAHIHMLQ